MRSLVAHQRLDVIQFQRRAAGEILAPILGDNHQITYVYRLNSEIVMPLRNTLANTPTDARAGVDN